MDRIVDVFPENQQVQARYQLFSSTWRHYFPAPCPKYKWRTHCSIRDTDRYLSSPCDDTGRKMTYLTNVIQRHLEQGMDSSSKWLWRQKWNAERLPQTLLCLMLYTPEELNRLLVGVWFSCQYFFTKHTIKIKLVTGLVDAPSPGLRWIYFVKNSSLSCM